MGGGTGGSGPFKNNMAKFHTAPLCYRQFHTNHRFNMGKEPKLPPTDSGNICKNIHGVLPRGVMALEWQRLHNALPSLLGRGPCVYFHLKVQQVLTFVKWTTLI